LFKANDIVCSRARAAANANADRKELAQPENAPKPPRDLSQTSDVEVCNEAAAHVQDSIRSIAERARICSTGSDQEILGEMEIGGGTSEPVNTNGMPAALYLDEQVRNKVNSEFSDIQCGRSSDGLFQYWIGLRPTTKSGMELCKLMFAKCLQFERTANSCRQ
jgi:hypothetical protein